MDPTCQGLVHPASRTALGETTGGFNEQVRGSENKHSPPLNVPLSTDRLEIVLHHVMRDFAAEQTTLHD
jgi:hypothetical protein